MKRCRVMFCGNSNLTGHTMHQFPKVLKYRRLWTRFVQLKRADFVMPDEESHTNCHICEAHFTGESYKPGEEFKVRMKRKKNRSLEDHAVPTINPQTPENLEKNEKMTVKAAKNVFPPKRTGSAASMLVVARVNLHFIKFRDLEIIIKCLNACRDYRYVGV